MAAPRSVGPRFPGLTANPLCTKVPPGVCGSWPLLAVWDSQVHFRARKHASWPDPRSQSQSLCHALNPSSGQPTLAPSWVRRNDSRADAKQLSYEQHRAPNPDVQEHEKDPKLSRYPPYNSCCARILLATLHSAACVRSATLRLDKPQSLSSISSPKRLLHRWLAQRHEIGGGSGETVPLAKQGPICLRRTQHLLAHQNHIS